MIQMYLKTFIIKILFAIYIKPPPLKDLADTLGTKCSLKTVYNRILKNTNFQKTYLSFTINLSI